MAGIYIHVPFCRQACRYCDFYFTVSLRYLDDYLMALLREIELRKDFTGTEIIETIYFGGGTPSVLSFGQIMQVLDTLKKQFPVSEDCEITLEANPDDLTPDYLESLLSAGINRLSVGVQSFHQDDLSLMRRSHNEIQALKSIKDAAAQGFGNINLDLIYGVPGLSLKKWRENLEKVAELPINHISAYHLSFEAGTVFDHWRKKGKLKEVEDSISQEQYELLREITGKNGFEHYEISNFAKRGFQSRHNSSYWENKVYLGLGPGAHSYNGDQRSWNISSLKKYTLLSEKGSGYNETEELTEKDRLNDYLIISLRTRKGVDLAYFKAEFGTDNLNNLMDSVKKQEEAGVILIEGERMRIDTAEWLKADLIIRDLIV